MITLENCNPQPIRLAIEGVTATAGDADAWDVAPREDERTLGPRDKLQLAASFRPRRAGRHVAQIRLSIDGAPGEIELVRRRARRAVRADELLRVYLQPAAPAVGGRRWPGS